MPLRYRLWIRNDPYKYKFHALKNFLAGNHAEADLQRGLALVSEDGLKSLSQFLGRDYDSMLAEVSFSYWQKLGGLNAAIVADDVVARRYHVMVGDEHHRTTGYCLVDAANRNILRESSANLPAWGDIFTQYRLFDFYETVRGLPFFDPNHCPILECQLTQGLVYFLQHHMTRDFSGSTHRLTREARPGEVEFTALRGATPTDGYDVLAAIELPDFDLPVLDPIATAAIGSHEYLLHDEVLWRFHLAALLSGAGKDLAVTLLDLCTGHTKRSAIFKPAVSVFGDLSKLIPEADVKLSMATIRNENQYAHFKFHVTSDGGRALVRYDGILV